MKSRINLLAVLVCVVMHGMLGAAWFGIFAEPWARMVGHTMAEFQAGGSAISYVFSIFQSVVMALLLAWLFNRMGIRSLGEGARTGLMIGFATVFVAFVTNYSFAMRPMQLALIDSLYSVLSLTIMGAILGAWQTKEQRATAPAVQRV